MSAFLSISIGSISVRASSGIDARRLADALPRALEAALAEGAVRPARPTPVERAAWAVADAVREKQP
ncbi:hypothetical protein [Sphingomonas sp.]|uniref:hypothetical protein n=1 Tax=Sphingomonas sp. TaxID=28214 RepID=UPI001B1F5A4C|nr:hypothetical protein [Sphingomonas sp.]MBO9713885.1 hypothetical protein [Sphingomonas sp.]